MATRVIRSTVRRQSGRKMALWCTATSITPTTLASATSVVFEICAAATIQAIGQQGHIARSRGRVIGRAATGGQDPIAVWGLGLFTTGLTTAAAFPQPGTETREPYFAWGALLILLL